MADQSLKNKKIVISAGASGIGLATAKVCLSRGATVYLCDLNERFVNVEFSEGILNIDWKKDNNIYMTGKVSEIKKIEVNL